MARFDIDGVFYFMAAAAVLLTLMAAGRSMIRAAPSHLERPFEVLAPQAAPFAHDPLGFPDDPSSPNPATRSRPRRRRPHTSHLTGHRPRRQGPPFHRRSLPSPHGISKRTMCRPTRQRYRGRLIRLGEMSDDDAQPLHRGSGGSTYTRKAHATREAPERGRSGMTNQTPARDRLGAVGWRRGS